jgi:hypothetical protein
VVWGEEFVEPAAGDAVRGGDFGDGSLLEDDGGDDQAGLRHARTLVAG